MKNGETYTRTCDGYVFRVVSQSRTVRGAHLQCVDATRVFGWYTFDEIRRGFRRGSK